MRSSQTQHPDWPRIDIPVRETTPQLEIVKTAANHDDADDHGLRIRNIHLFYSYPKTYV